MRKLTGYIGAMIIVFALMGSILAGYALNINGNSTVINDYEKVTDVSGLYNHSEEKTYIEYNPASNYTGYSTIGSYDNDNAGIAGTYTFKRINGGTHTIVLEGANVTIDGITATQTFDPASYHLQFICNKFYCQYSPVTSANRLYIYNENTQTFYQKITLSIDNNTVSYNAITTSNTTVSGTITTDGQHLAYYTGADWDYIQFRIYGNPNITGDIPAYYSDEWPIYLACQYQGMDTVFKNESGYIMNNNTNLSLNTLYSDTNVGYGVNHTDTIISNVVSGYESAIPRTVYYNGLFGINYTESNRVNNYPVVNENASTQIQTDKIDLMNISASDYWPADTSGLGFKKTWYIVSQTGGSLPQYQFTAPYYTTTSQSSDNRAYLHDYKLSDILNTYNIPSNTHTLKITSNSNDIRNYTDNGISVNIDCNVVGFVYLPTQNILTLTNACLANEKDFIIYDLDNGVCTVYDYNGVSKFTAPPSDIGVLFCDNTANYGWLTNVYSGGTTSQAYDMGGRARPFIDITSTIYNPADIDYIDITKGYTIKSSNTYNTTWDNEFENGNIRLLFRAIDVNGTYQNTITVCGNDINIDYTNNRYYITLGADTIDVGTWRNIVLDIDLINGKLSAIPVRTFNSFTNVILDNSVVNIGDLTDASPTNTITWAPTNNSLMFNVYSTDVFLNTYGVVMINPSLTIMDYFPDLGQFYRLKMYNFATYGDSITINGETYPVTNGTITIDNKIVTLKNLYIEYANGDVTVKDDHIEINTGAIVSDTVSMAGTWYFLTDLEKGYTAQKMVYDWDWGAFIVDNTQFAVIYVGLLGVSLIVARRFCNLSITDYALMIVSVIIALSVQVIA